MLISVDKKSSNSNWQLRGQKVKGRSVMSLKTMQLHNNKISTNSQAHSMSWRTLRRARSTSWKTSEICQMAKSNAMTFGMNQI